MNIPESDTLMVVDKSHSGVAQASRRLAYLIHALNRPEGGRIDRTYWPIIDHPTENLQAAEYAKDADLPINWRTENIGEDGNPNGTYTTRQGVVEAIAEIASLLGYTNNQARSFVENNSTFTVFQLLSNAPNLPHPKISFITKEQAIADGWYDYDEE